MLKYKVGAPPRALASSPEGNSGFILMMSFCHCYFVLDQVYGLNGSDLMVYFHFCNAAKSRLRPWGPRVNEYEQGNVILIRSSTQYLRIKRSVIFVTYQRKKE